MPSQSSRFRAENCHAGQQKTTNRRVNTPILATLAVDCLHLDLAFSVTGEGTIDVPNYKSALNAGSGAQLLEYLPVTGIDTISQASEWT